MKNAASVDITIGHAIDSLFEPSEVSDPWAYSSLSRFVNAALNHKHLAFTYPSASAIANDDDDNLPLIFAKARGKNVALIDGLKGRPADAMPITSGEAKAQFNEFANWLASSSEHSKQLRRWVEYHQRKKRISVAHKVTVPSHYAADLVARADINALGEKYKLSPIDAEYAIDVFLRGIQYAKACGNHIAYSSHPVRASLAIQDVERQFEAICAWSWGSYFVQLLREEKRYRSASFLLEKIQALKSHTLSGATWYTLADAPPSEQVAKVRHIANEAKLPFKLSPDGQKQIEQNLRGAGTTAPIVATLANLVSQNPVLAAFVNVLVTAGTLKSVEASKGYIEPGEVTGVLLTKYQYWPGLSDET